jgi:hypothetical protein
MKIVINRKTVWTTAFVAAAGAFAWSTPLAGADVVVGRTTGNIHYAVRPHERIDAAIDALDHANEELDHAADDYGGRKHEAMEKVRDAKIALVESREHSVHEALHKVEEAQRMLRACEDSHRGPHVKIHEAIEILEHVKEQLL